MVAVISIPKELSERGDLILIPREEYEELLLLRPRERKEKVTENDVLRWVKEATILKRAGRLPMLKSLVDLNR